MNFSRFETLTKEEKEKLTLSDFLVSEIQEIIKETAFREEDAEIAELRFIKRKTVEWIAEKKSFDNRTIKRRLRKIEKLLKQTILKIL